MHHETNYHNAAIKNDELESTISRLQKEIQDLKYQINELKGELEAEREARAKAELLRRNLQGEFDQLKTDYVEASDKSQVAESISVERDNQLRSAQAQLEEQRQIFEQKLEEQRNDFQSQIDECREEELKASDAHANVVGSYKRIVRSLEARVEYAKSHNDIGLQKRIRFLENLVYTIFQTCSESKQNNVYPEA
uniref:Myosin_tail_1 domain-containing protein n=1 Tax=Panagrellus redivivus TaxID=6233 RepID=A0A7E4VMH2_PANRE